MLKELNEKEWGVFSIDSIYANYHGKRLNKVNRVEGSVPMLTAGENNQGVAGFISNLDMPLHTNFVSVDMFGNAFFHRHTATGDDNIYFFENNQLSNAVKEFTCVCIRKQACKFSYGKQFRQNNADNLKIMLPVDATGNPDYAYMEQYASEKRGGAAQAL